MADPTPLLRPERYLEATDAAASGVVEKPLSAWQRICNVGAVRKRREAVQLRLAD